MSDDSWVWDVLIAGAVVLGVIALLCLMIAVWAALLVGLALVIGVVLFSTAAVIGWMAPSLSYTAALTISAVILGCIVLMSSSITITTKRRKRRRSDDT